ncbi:TRAP transporter substrate-binding protein DctP [Rhizobium sp. CG5]|uniref:TRAP transporter substrate-binding protein n=1 Tax=Rhizobium sp. CG5 TaxID=2726076 RepID=UPI0020332F5E|nr:TRAP transporter substrate-binding protein DctP [Rhizobium sp. CG5]MCM2472416.1 TRAP transporter substrate-binding protein DctP [Rhizobium sp. CG5]
MFKRILTAGLASVLGLAASAAMAEPVQLKLAFFNADTDSTWTGVLRPFMEAVNADGKGIIEIQGYPNGALSRNAGQQPQVVLDGVADIAFATLGQSAGRFPNNGVLELPGIFSNITESSYTFTRLVAADKLKGYSDFVVLGAFGGDPSGIHMNVPISSYKDIAGKKIRATNPTEALTLRRLGAAPVVLPTPETVEAIARGTVEGTAMQSAPVVDYGIDRVVSHHYYGRFSNAPLAVLMNKEKFESLPAPAQEILRKYGGEWMADRWIEATGGANDRAVAKFKADPKQTVVYPSEAEMAELKTIYKDVIDEFTAKDPHNKELLADLQKTLEEVRADRPVR